MAQKDGERRMLFDTRGKRRNVIRVVYATLALLMGGSLFLVVGPFNLAELVGGSGEGDAAEVFEKQEERIERRLAANPQDEQLLLSLTRAQLNAANANANTGEGEGALSVTPAIRREYEEARDTWRRYLKVAGDEASVSGAQLVAVTFFGLAERGSNTLSEVKENVATAAAAQRVAAERQPTIGSLSSLATYEYFDGDIKAARRAEAEALAKAVSKGEEEAIEQQLAQFRESAASFQKGLKTAEEQEQESGREALQDPFGLGGTPGQ